jgi:hypothetical protein
VFANENCREYGQFLAELNLSFTIYNDCSTDTPGFKCDSTVSMREKFFADMNLVLTISERTD